MKYEYGEPLRQAGINDPEIFTDDGPVFAYFDQQEKRRRVIACINACAGLSNEELEKIGLGGVAKIMAEIMPTDLASAVRGGGHAAKNVYGNNSPVAGPRLIPEEAEEWEWTGEQPRRLGDGESGIRSHCVNANCCESGRMIVSFSGEETHSFYWPLRRRQHTQSTEASVPQAATLNDIADLLRRILNRMPEGGVE